MPKFAADDAVQHVLHRDHDTRGVLQLQKVGARKYAADDRTEVLCCTFCVDSEPVKLWLPGDPVPAEFLEAAHDPALLACAHNAQFELTIEHLIMRRRRGWPKIPLRQQRCAMAAALALALPPKPELVAKALELLHQKDRAGQRLMLMMSKPRRPRKDGDPRASIGWTTKTGASAFTNTAAKTWRLSASLSRSAIAATSAPGPSWCAVLTAKAERGRKVSALPTTSRTPTTSTCSISGVENLKSEGGENGKR